MREQKKNRHRKRNFTGFAFEIDSHEYKDKTQQTKYDFSINDLIMICNVLCIKNCGSFDEIAVRIIFRLWDLKTLKSNIIPEHNDNRNNDDENNSSDADSNSSSNINDVKTIYEWFW